MAKPKDEDGLPVVFDPFAQTDLSYPVEMVHSIAQGLEPPEDIAARFGFEGDRWRRLIHWEPFKNDVIRRQDELKESGWVFRTKAALFAEMLQDDITKIALGAEVSLSQKLAVYESLRKSGDLEPKKEVAQGQAGAGFSITINLDRAQSIASVKKVETIDMEPT